MAGNIRVQRLYFGWNYSGLDSFHRELLMYHLKIYVWKRFVAMRHKLVMLCHNMRDTDFLEWLLTK